MGRWCVVLLGSGDRSCAPMLLASASPPDEHTLGLRRPALAHPICACRWVCSLQVYEVLRRDVVPRFQLLPRAIEPMVIYSTATISLCQNRAAQDIASSGRLLAYLRSRSKILHSSSFEWPPSADQIVAVSAPIRAIIFATSALVLRPSATDTRSCDLADVNT